MVFVTFFFFKQKTAYEMRISDWSSDVCSSDLPRRDTVFGRVEHQVVALDARRHRLGERPHLGGDGAGGAGGAAADPVDVGQPRRAYRERGLRADHESPRFGFEPDDVERFGLAADLDSAPLAGGNRQRGVAGKRGSVRVDTGGARNIKKNKPP